MSLTFSQPENTHWQVILPPMSNWHSSDTVSRYVKKDVSSIIIKVWKRIYVIILWKISSFALFQFIYAALPYNFILVILIAFAILKFNSMNHVIQIM